MGDFLLLQQAPFDCKDEYGALQVKKRCAGVSVKTGPEQVSRLNDATSLGFK